MRVNETGVDETGICPFLSQQRRIDHADYFLPFQQVALLQLLVSNISYKRGGL